MKLHLSGSQKKREIPKGVKQKFLTEHMLWVFGVHSLVFSHKKILGNYKSFFEVQAWLRNLNKSAMKSGKSTCNFLYDTTHSQEHNIMHELYIFHKHKKHTFGILESSFFQTTSFPTTQKGIVGDFKCISIWQLSQPHARLSWKPHWSRIAGISKF